MNDRTPQSPVNSLSLIWVDPHTAPAAADLSKRAAGAWPESAHKQTTVGVDDDNKRQREEKLRQRRVTSASVTHALSACGRHVPLFEQCKLHLVQVFSKSGLTLVFLFFPPSSRRLRFFFQ